MFIMAHLPPVITKTKKWSYKRLSKLNEDNLIDLRRVERPENSTQVVYYNSITKARLRSDVNVWFKDHHHTIALINKQQKDTWDLLCRVQRDRHRAMRDEYKRKQQKIRDSFKTLQVELMQKRVIEKFRTNAANKMAARGERSVGGLKPTAHRCKAKMKNCSSESAVREGNAYMLGEIDNHAPVVCKHKTDDGGNPCKDDNLEKLSQELRTRSLVDITESKCLAANSNHSKHGSADSERSEHGNQMRHSSKQPLHTSIKEPDASRSDIHYSPSTLNSRLSRDKAHRRSTASNESLGRILEALSPHSGSKIDTEEDRVSEKGKTHEDCLHLVRNSSVSIGGRVVGIRNNRYGSLSTFTKGKHANGENLPEVEQPVRANNSLPPLQVQLANLPRHITPKLGSLVRSLPYLKPIPRASSVDVDEATVTKVSVWHNQNHQQQIMSASSRNVSCGNSIVQNNTIAPSTEKACLKGEHRRPTIWRTSMAYRIRLQRQQEARQRAKLLDDEPVVQYRRGARGSLQPLLTETIRRHFPVPTGRPKYQRKKLLKAEQQKALARQLHINKFLTELGAHRKVAVTGESQAAIREDKTGNPATNKNHLHLLLERMCLQLPGQCLPLHQDPAEQMAKCRYLRVHDGDMQTIKDTRNSCLTSWTDAERRLKAGAVALNMMKHS